MKMRVLSIMGIKKALRNDCFSTLITISVTSFNTKSNGNVVSVVPILGCAYNSDTDIIGN